MMARHAERYPQVELGAGALVDAALLPAPAGIAIGEALALVRRRDVAGLLVGTDVVLRDDLVRASTLGVSGARAAALARALPVVDARATEVGVRRHLAAGAPLVVVRDGKRVLGGVVGTPSTGGAMALSDRLGRRLPVAARAVVDAVARVASERGAHAFLAGGVVRDALADRALDSPDLDLVIEGDGPGVARGLARALAAPIVEHDRFLTATVRPADAGRVDVATARSERYEARGMLPRVIPASIEADLRRRDFTVNAMAVELASGTFGLLDPHGGRADLAARHLRILHPASFVEDPTRIFRAARYAERLGLRMDKWTARCQAWALSLAPYPALSGGRLRAELEHILDEPRPDAVLVRLGVAGAYRLLDPRHRFTRAVRAAVLALPATLAWTRARALDVLPLDAVLTALLTAQPADVVGAVLRRLDVSGEPAARIARTVDGRVRLGRVLGAPARASERARRLRACDPLELAWAWRDGDAARRAHVEAFLAGTATRASLRGDDVIALGVPPGPAVAAALEALRDARLDGEVGERSEEEAFVRAWARAGHGRRSSRKEW